MRTRMTLRAGTSGLVAGLLAALLCVVVVFRASEGHEGRAVHEEGDGILSATSSSGGKGLFRPHGLTRGQRWHGSFGGLLLCVDVEESASVRLDGVRYLFAAPPRTHRTWVRVVPHRAEQHPGEPIEWAPFYGLVGVPGAFRRGTIHGDFTPFRRGLEITDSCSDGPYAFTELITVLETGPSGAWSRGVLIDYTADGEEYTLRVPWEMATCGTRTREFCRPVGASG